MATNTRGSVAARAKREGGYRLSGGSASTAGGSKSSSNRKSSKYTIIGNKVVDQTTGNKVELSSVGGNLSKAIEQLKDPILKTPATIQGKVYTNARQSEILNNQLRINSQARLSPGISQRRALSVASARRLNEGRGTSADLFNVLSVRTGRIENMVSKSSTAFALRNRNEKQAFRNNVVKSLSSQQKNYYNTLPISEKDAYLLNVASRKIKPETNTTTKPVLTKKKQLSNSRISSKLEDWGNSINKRRSEAERKSAQKEANLLAGRMARNVLITKLPTGTKTIGKGVNALIKLGEITFKGGVDFGAQLANAGEQVVFLLPALGRSISDRSTINFLNELNPLTGEKKRVLKEIYSNPRTYRDALIGAAVANVLGGVKSGKLTARNVQRIPKTAKNMPRGTIFKDARNNIGYVSKSGLVKPIPRGFRTITRSLSRPVTEFISRSIKVNRFPKSSAKVAGTVFRNKRGDVRVVNKNGRVVKPTKLQEIRLKGENILGAKARLTKGNKISKALNKDRSLRIYDKKLAKEINSLISKYNLKGKDRLTFKKYYRELKIKGTDKSARIIRRLSDQIEVDKGVRLIDRRIKARQTPRKGRVMQKKKVARPKPTAKDIQKANQFQARMKADTQARKKGFSDYSEQFKYEQTFQKYRQGVKGAENILRKIERAMSKRKVRASKVAAKRYSQLRNQIISDAYKKLRSGRLRIRDKKYKVVARRSPMRKVDADRLAIAIDTRLQKVEDVRYRRQAKEAMADILEGQQIIITDPKLNAAIRRLLNKEQIRLLRQERFIRIAKGEVKGKMPQVGLTTSQRRAIRSKAKAETRLARIARKRAKRQFAGIKQSRKAIRKMIREDIRRIERIIKGDARVPEGYSLDITPNGYKLTPRATKIAKGSRIRTAEQILKKTNLKKSDGVNIGKDGTIQILKTETKTISPSLQHRKLAVRSAIKNLQKQIRRPKKYSVQKTKLVRKVSAKNVRRIKFRKIKGRTTTQAIRSAVSIISGLSQRVAQKTNQSPRSSQISNVIQAISQDMRIAKGEVKGKMPRVGLTKSQRRAIRSKAKAETRLARIARKRAKRQFAGTKQSRKAIRKMIREDIRRIERIIQGDARVPAGYTLEITQNGYKLVPKVTKIPKGSRIRTAEQILRKTNLKNSDGVNIGRDGTIQILKTETTTISPSLQQRKLAVRSAIKNLQKQIRRPKKYSVQKTKLVRKVSAKNVRRIKFRKIKGRTTTQAIRSAVSIISGLSQRVAQKTNQSPRSSQISNVIQAISQDMRIAQAVIMDMGQIKKLDLSKAQNTAVIQVLRKAQKVESRIKTYQSRILKQRRVPRKKKPTRKVPIPVIPPFFKLGWGKKLPRGYHRKVNGYVKIGDKRLLVVRGAPENIAWNTVFSKGTRRFRSVDGSVARSFEFKIVGVTKAKDSHRKIGVKKVTGRIGRDPKVLRLVEKSKYAIDSRGEKQGLSVKKRRRKLKRSRRRRLYSTETW